MYYHAVVETTDKDKNGNYERWYEFDRTNLDEVLELIVLPYGRKEQIYIGGRYIERNRIRLLQVKSSERPMEDVRAIAQSTVSRGVIFVYTAKLIVDGDKFVSDITKELLKSAGGILKPATPVASDAPTSNDSIFIVHGRDELAKTEAARFVEKLGFKAIVLHEQASSGKTIIEKIEDYTNVGFAIVLYTPCDVGGLAGEKVHRPRARQNVVFEHGYLIGKLGRKHVCALVKGNDVEIPNDISGVVYVPMDSHRAWHVAVAKELRNSGYAVDMNKVI